MRDTPENKLPKSLKVRVNIFSYEFNHKTPKKKFSSKRKTYLYFITNIEYFDGKRFLSNAILNLCFRVMKP